jgi:PKD repeat protein
MRTLLLAAAAALLCVSCIKRVAPDPGGDRTALSGASTRFTEREQVPEESVVEWDFGDGTQAKGQTVDHAFPHAGVYTVVETIVDKDGKSRTARTHVSVVRRDVAMAVPAQIHAALIAQRPWARTEFHRQVAERLSLGQVYDDVQRSIAEATGFDPLDPKALEANGFDPDEGVALYTVPEDPEALVFTIGTSDDAKALESVKRVAAKGGIGRYVNGPFQFAEATLPGGVKFWSGVNAAGDKIGVLQRFGYLYLRTPGATDPALALASSAAILPEKGLYADAGYQNALRHIGTGDFVFYSRTAEGERLSSEFTSTAFTILEKPNNQELVQLRLFAQPRTLTGDKLVAAFTPEKPPTDLATQLPAGASAYLNLSAAPAALWGELVRTAGADTTRIRERLAATTGLDLEHDLIPSFSGNVSIGVYLDATSLVEAMLGEEVGSFDRSEFVIAAQLARPDTVRTALDRVKKPRPARDRAQFAGWQWYRLADGAQAAIKGDTLLLSIGGPPLTEEAPPAKGKGKRKPAAQKPWTIDDLGLMGRAMSSGGHESLSAELKHVGVTGFDQQGQQGLWINLAGLVRSIEKAGAEQGGAAGQGARLFADRAAGLRDALVLVHPGKEGVDGDLWLRFAGKRAAAK